MTFQESIKTCFSKYVTWKGRASRSEFWFFVLFFFGGVIVSSVIDRALGTGSANGVGIVYAIFVLATFLPYLAVLVRRLHDTGRSGWWYWIALIPLVGVILLIVWFAAKGTTGSNEYGEDPLGGELAAAFS
ncbi:MAG: DUF805 domain-containing protein [Novosphingobium sp.]